MSTNEKISRRTWLKGMVCSAAAGLPLSVGSPSAKAPISEILPPTEKDLVADFGGSLPAWNPYLAANKGSLTLTIPAGTYGNFATGDYLASGAQANTTIVGAAAISMTGPNRSSAQAGNRRSRASAAISSRTQL
jgi:hypothetical protein